MCNSETVNKYNKENRSKMKNGNDNNTTNNKLLVR